MIEALGVKVDTKTALLIGGAALLAYAFYKWKNGITDNLTEKAATLQQGLQHPVDALGAFVGGLFGITPTVSGSLQMTPAFSNYIAEAGGVDAYILAHKNGTFAGKPFVTPSTPNISSNIYNVDAGAGSYG